MAIIRVKFSDVKPLLQKSFIPGEDYSYSQISDFLTNNFNGINSNQIAGLISRMGQTEIFKKSKNKGERIKYIYQGEKFKSDLKISAYKSLNKCKKELIQLKLDVKDTSDFKWLQNQIDQLENQIKTFK